MMAFPNTLVFMTITNIPMPFTSESSVCSKMRRVIRFMAFAIIHLLTKNSLSQNAVLALSEETRCFSMINTEALFSSAL